MSQNWSAGLSYSGEYLFNKLGICCHHCHWEISVVGIWVVNILSWISAAPHPARWCIFSSLHPAHSLSHHLHTIHVSTCLSLGFGSWLPNQMISLIFMFGFLCQSSTYIYISIPKWPRNIVQQCARDLVPLPLWTFQAFLGFSLLNPIYRYLCLNPAMCILWKYKYVHISVVNILSCMSTLPFKSPLAYCQFHPPVALLYGHLIRWAWPQLVNQNTSFSWEFSSQNSGIFLKHTPQL